jgi:DNA invertase Pin-like site-specific DNA recombinase
LSSYAARAAPRFTARKVTGAHSDRRELLKMLDALAPGDVVTVTGIDRLARSNLRPVRYRQADRGKAGRVTANGDSD